MLAEPPAFSIADFAVLENASAVTESLDFNSPLPRIFTKSFFWTRPLSIKILDYDMNECTLP